MSYLNGVIDIRMDNHSKEIYGSIVQALGTIVAAIGSTPSVVLKEEDLQTLNLWGNVLQAVGNALEADGQGKVSLEKIGNEIQSIGNATVTTGLVINFNTETIQKLIINGNWLQALGGLVNVADEFEDETMAGQAYNIIGNLLQAIGNSMQAFSGVYQLNTMDNPFSVQTLDVVGSWIQAMGSIISVIGQVLEETEETKLGIDE